MEGVRKRAEWKHAMPGWGMPGIYLVHSHISCFAAGKSKCAHQSSQSAENKVRRINLRSTEVTQEAVWRLLCVCPHIATWTVLTKPNSLVRTRVTQFNKISYWIEFFLNWLTAFLMFPEWTVAQTSHPVFTVGSLWSHRWTCSPLSPVIPECYSKGPSPQFSEVCKKIRTKRIETFHKVNSFNLKRYFILWNQIFLFSLLFFSFYFQWL